MIEKIKQIRRNIIAKKCFNNDYNSIVEKYNKGDYNKSIYSIMNEHDSIDYIIKNNVSVCRFGDGEFRWMMEENNVPAFQKPSKKLSKRLKEIIKSNNDNILICIPELLINQIKATKKADYFWKLFNIEYRKKLNNYLPNDKLYGDTNLTRPYMDYKDKKSAKNRFLHLQELWNNRNVVIIEGEKSRLGVGNDLFNNTKSIKRIIAPGKNAFDRYDEILKISLKNIKKTDLVLIALGPTATVLAYDLGNKGYQSIDIGHIDVEYEWFLMKANKKTNIKNKAVNETNNYDDVGDENDSKYLQEIIYRI